MTGTSVSRRGFPTVRGLPDIGRCRVIGVVNVTPDSFSDGGQWFETDDAVGHGLELAAAGADLVDVGGESTRPGARRIPVGVELRRVVPVVHALAAEGVAVSIDTTRAVVAERALEAGASVVNDVSGGYGDLDMLPLVAAAGVPYILMHSRGPSVDMQQRATYSDVVTEVCDELRRGFDRALAAGVDAEQIVLDPGLGFAKTGDHNWALLTHLDRLISLGRPVLVAAARKSFLGNLLAAPDGTPRSPAERDSASSAITAIAAAAGAWAVRVHEVRADVDAVRVAARWREER